MADINYALVEDIRPPIYTAMKYWGKKPHNIWNNYISNYTSPNGFYLDPFTGSAISALEAYKAGRKAIAFDLNPLSSFILEVLTSDFDETVFKIAVAQVINEIEKDQIYQKYFTTSSRHSHEASVLQHAKWENNIITSIGVKEIKNKEKLYLATPNDEDIHLAENMINLEIPYWYPNKPFHITPSISAGFISMVGGNNFSNLWTKRNLYVLSKIFDLIVKTADRHIQKQLLFGFIQSLHLCTKMNIPRREAANRDFSTSWGRSAYLCSNRQMEMNALLVFQGSCLGKQSVTSALKRNKEYLGGKLPILYKVSSSNKDKSKLTGFDIKYGVINALSLSDYIPNETIDFIMTDPPYGGLVQYLDLSTLWLGWLEHLDPIYKPNFGAEITIKKGEIDLKTYQSRFSKALSEMYKILKMDGKIVFTFHNKDLKIWNSFLRAISSAGFKIEKVIHQQNRRSGEANVSNPYGTSGSDFYIRCIKGNTNLKNDDDKFRHFVKEAAIRIVANRNEPTPYEFLLSGLLVDISSAGYDLDNFDEHIKNVLNESLNNIFVISSNDLNKAGNLWWFKNPQDYIKFPDRPLSDRVEYSIQSLLLREGSITFDQALADIFSKYPNGLTPDLHSVDKILKKYANKSQGKWVVTSSAKDEYTHHTDYLNKLANIGKKMGYSIFIGQREQREKINGKKLSDITDIKNLKFLASTMELEKIKRIEMIDMIWIKDNKIEFALEVENTTNFMSGIQRGSNLDSNIPKIMIIPNKRENEFKKLTDPLFLKGFKDNGWKFMTYNEVDKLAVTAKLDVNFLNQFLYKLQI